MADVEIVASPDLEQLAVATTREEMEVLGARIVESMKAHHSYTDRTGHLTASMGFEVEPDGALEVGAKEFYARFLEEGTSHAPAHPFLLPALMDNASVA